MPYHIVVTAGNRLPVVGGGSRPAKPRHPGRPPPILLLLEGLAIIVVEKLGGPRVYLGVAPPTIDRRGHVPYRICFPSAYCFLPAIALPNIDLLGRVGGNYKVV